MFLRKTKRAELDVKSNAPCFRKSESDKVSELKRLKGPAEVWFDGRRV